MVVLGLTEMEEPTLPLWVVPFGQVGEGSMISIFCTACHVNPRDLVMRWQMAWSTPSAALASGLRVAMASNRLTAQ